MAASQPGSLLTHFATLTDPRVERCREHHLLDILVIAICGVVCNCDSWVDIETFGKAKFDWFRTFLRLPNGIPSHDTFGRVFARLDPDEFAACFRAWMAEVSERLGLKHVAIDGKTLRGSREKGKAALHLVSAWASAHHLTLGQVATEAKSNEIAAIPKLLQLLELEGAIVTIDAMGCQKDIAAEIRQQKADYVLAVKANQERLHDDVQRLAAAALGRDFAGLDLVVTDEANHGRQEFRMCYVSEDLSGIRDAALWCDLACVVVVVSDRANCPGAGSEVRYYISSRILSAAEFAAAIRGHWGIENSCHWVLDVSFREDASRVRKDNGPANFAVLRRLALSLLKANEEKGSVRGKRLLAGWDNAFLERILHGFSKV